MRTLRMTTFIKLFLVFLLLCIYEIVYSQTEIIYEDIINSSPPPDDYVQLKSAMIDPIDLVALEVPSYLWSYGCAPTAAAMLIGYYDQSCFPSLYTGLKNGGKAPFNNSFWRKNLNIPGKLNYDNSISVSMNGYDQQNTNGHFDDFWECNKCFGDDPHPYIGSTPPHNFSVHPCVGDYMGTSQDYFNNLDGSTRFYNSSTNSKVINYFKCESETPKYRDGNHGLRLFIESCDYSVEENFNQNIFGLKGVQAGFTYEDFKVEIDAGRPVLIHFTNHTAIGFGYSNSTRSIRIYTTWSEGPWDMVWGSNLTANGSLAMLSVSIIKLHGSTLKSACMIPTGINDVVNIQNPPSGTVYYLGSWIIPNNTNLMTPCTNASFYAQFQTDYDPRTTACTFDWKLVLYHSGGEYIYAQQNGIVENANTPNSTGEGCVWQPSLSALPAYNWSIDYNGNIYGKVSVVVHKCNGGGDVIDDFEIGVQLYSKIKDITYAVNSTINATCTKLNLTNVGITSPASVTFNCNRLGIAINGTFQAAKGSTLTINK